MIEAVIFDMDGVIVDSEPLHLQVDKNFINSCGIDISEDELRKYIGISNVDLWEDLIKKHNLNYSIEELTAMQRKNKIKAFEESDLKPIDGVVELITKIKNENIKIALASSSSMDFINTVLKRANLNDKFDYILSGENFENGKPEPDIFLAAASLLKKAPSQCVVIEDSSHGIHAANRAKIKCIGFRNIGSGVQDLSHADMIIDNFKELTIDMIKNL